MIQERYMDKIFKKEGFTLIEILVVLSIIGILLSIVYVSFNSSRVEAKNKAMQSDLKSVQLALELYKAQNGNYPVAGGTYPAPLSTALVPDFIAKLPVAADSANSECTITYQGDGSWYKLIAEQCRGGVGSQAEGTQADDEFARCLPSCTGCDPTDITFYESYAVYSPGGECE